MQMTRAWPTLLVGLAVYGLFFGTTLNWQQIPLPLLVVLGAITAAWHASLEHEIIHGHPTRWPWLNRLLVLAPMLVWLPYETYAQTHRAHHRDQTLTDPFDDPESYYIAQGRWDRLAPWQQKLLRACNSLAGRLTLGAALMILLTWKDEALKFWHGTDQRRRIWATHLALVAGFLAYLHWVCAMPVWLYLLCFSLPGTSLTMLRAFLEHQYAPDPKHRSVIVEASWFWRLLFLNNSLHLVHHQHPALPWYNLPREYARHRDAYQRLNGGYVWPGYGAIARAYAIRSKEPARHPAR